MTSIQSTVEVVHAPEVVQPASIDSHVISKESQNGRRWWHEELNVGRLFDTIRTNPGAVFPVIIFGCVVTAMFVGGLAWSFLIIITGRLRAVFRLRPHRFPKWGFGELARITLLIVLMASLLPFIHIGLVALYPEGPFDQRLWVSVGMLAIDSMAVLVMLNFAAGKAASAWKALGFSRKKLRSSMLTGLKGYVGLFPWLAGLLVTMVFAWEAFNLPLPEQPIFELLFAEKRTGALILTVLLACIVGPIAEEMFFRGILYPAMRRKTSRLVSTLVSAALFSLVHANPVGFLPIMALGCLFADLYERTGSLVAPVATHIAHNSLMMAFALYIRYAVSLT